MMLVFQCLAGDCAERCALTVSQVEAIDVLAETTDSSATCVPLGTWVFFKWDDRLLGACPTHVRDMPRPDSVVPVLQAGGVQ
jgi:hypothetical protein